MAACCGAASVSLVASGLVPLPEGGALVLGALGNPYCTGPVAALVMVLGEAVARLLPSCWAWGFRLAGLAAVCGVAAWCLNTLPAAAADNAIARLYLATALGTLGTAALAAVFLLASGVLAARRLAAVAWDWALVFGPFVIYLACAGFGLALVGELRPRVDDPQLLRMDESLGFHASMVFGSFDYVGTWAWDAQYLVYAGIGALALAVAGALYLGGKNFALRRCLLGILLVGVLGWIGYWLFPVVGPLAAWPELFHGAPAAREAALATALAREVPLVLSPEIARDSVPSLHTAWALIVLAAAWKAGRRLFFCALPCGLLSIFTTLTLCRHYTADLLAALPFAAFCWWLADALARCSCDGKDAPLLQLAGPGRARLTFGFFALLAICLTAWTVWSWAAPLSPLVVWPGLFLLLVPTALVAFRLGSEDCRR